MICAESAGSGMKALLGAVFVQGVLAMTGMLLLKSTT